MIHRAGFEAVEGIRFIPCGKSQHNVISIFMIIQTKTSKIEIAEPMPEMSKKLDSLMPFGFSAFAEPHEGCKFGFVRKKGDQEVSCLKQQPIETSQETAQNWEMMHNFVIREAYIKYIDIGFSGAYLACT